jgi:serine/threonine protein kinase
VTKHVKISGDKSKIEKEVQNLKREISLLKALSHKNIVKYIHTDVNEDKTAVDIILEYVPGGSIRALLSRFDKFEEKMVRKYTE